MRDTGPSAPGAVAPYNRFASGGTSMPGAHAQSQRRVGSWFFDQPYLLLSLTSLFWAGNTILGRFIVGHVPPMTLAFIRWSGAFLILLPFAVRHLIHDWPLIRKHAGVLTLI